MPGGSLQEEQAFGDYVIRTYDTIGPSGVPCFDGSFIILKNGQQVYVERGGHFQIGIFWDEHAQQSIPVGYDLTADQIPDAMIYEYTGGAHCCTTYHVFQLGEEFRPLAAIYGGDYDSRFADLDGDGNWEFTVHDWAYMYNGPWPEAGKPCASPYVILHYANGGYHLAQDLMRTPALTDKELRALAESYAKDVADNHHPDENCSFWKDTAGLIYSGHPELVEPFLQIVWPDGLEQRETFLQHLLEDMRLSLYWPEIKDLSTEWPWPEMAPTLVPLSTTMACPKPAATPLPLEVPPPAPLAWLDGQGTLWLGADTTAQRLADGVAAYVWSPEGNEVALLREGDLWLLDVNEAALGKVLDSGRLTEIAWSPTGERLACLEEVEGASQCVVSEWEPTRVLLVNLQDGTSQVFFDGPLPEGDADAVWDVQWSPDGRTLYARACHAVTTASLLAFGVEDGSVVRITGLAWDYTVLPGQGSLLVAEHRYTDYGSHRVATEYSPAGVLVQEWPELEDTMFVPGPRGAVAFTMEQIRPTGPLSIRQADGTMLQTALELDQKTLGRGLQAILDWSSDGRWLAVEKAGEIWLVDSAGGEAQLLTDGHRPRWQPRLVQP